MKKVVIASIIAFILGANIGVWRGWNKGLDNCEYILREQLDIVVDLN